MSKKLEEFCGLPTGATDEQEKQGAQDGEGYAAYANARTEFSKAVFKLHILAMELISTSSRFERDPMFNKDFAKMVESDKDFAKQFIALKAKFKI